MAQYPATIELSSLNGTTGFTLSGEAASDASGYSVASAGDVNGDGFADLIVGAYGNAPGGVTRTGAAYVVFGKASGFASNIDLSGLNGTNGFKLSGVSSNDLAGHSVASAGDVNGDGYSDLIIGAFGADPNGASSGSSYVVFGKANGFASAIDLSALNGATGFRLDGVAANDYSGFSVASAGDVNGDGFDDVIVGAKFADPHGNLSGASYVVFGKANGFASAINLSSLDGNTGFSISGEAASDFSGSSVSSAGDVNGDGFADLMIGADGADANGNGSGASYVVFGKASGFAANIDLSGLTGTNGFKIIGANPNEYSGSSLGPAGDVNGDGYADLVIGARLANPHGTFSGATYVVFGKASGFAANIDLSSLDGTNGFKLNGVAAADSAGVSVSSAGDVNGDGLADLIVGAQGADPHGPSSGASYIVFGRLPDAAVSRTGTAASQNLVGGNFADVLTGGGGNDQLYGNGGNDLLTGGAGNDYFNGGTGTDTVSYQAAAAAVHVSLLLNTAQNTIGAGTDTLISIEKLVGSAFADTLIANMSGATLNGGPGGDDLFSGPGSDILNGGGASDFADYSLATAGVTVNLLNTGFQNTVGAGSDELVSIEKGVGSNFNDTITGDAGVNTLFGEGGNDSIDGGANGDYLFGNAGADTLNGGAGQDSLTGGAGNDLFVFAAPGDTLTAHPDTVLDFASGDKIDLHLIDADTGTAGDQAFHLGGGGGHAGDIVVSAFDVGNNRTSLSLYVDNNPSVDAVIWLTGDHHNISVTDFVL